ncbi:MAG TPA: putative quinol monooxygenase [Nitrospirales bacterium]|jgi:quinol monooxygenase YgiN
MPELTVIARIKAKRGREADLEREMRAIVVPTHAEAGCLRYALHRSLEDPTLFTTIERWNSKEAIDKHFGTPHIQSLLKKAGDLLAEPPEITVFELLPEGQSVKGSL